jgi:endonuclease IV
MNSPVCTIIDMQSRVEQVREMLAKAVSDALKKKRRLGQYAVVMHGGQPYRLLPAEMQIQEDCK